MVFVVLEAVEVLVTLSADIAAVGFVFLHSQSAGVGVQGFRVDD